MCEHRVRPMEHGGFDKGQGSVTQRHSVAGVHIFEVPVTIIVAAEYGFSACCAIYGHVWYFSQKFWQSAAMVDLVVVHDYEVYVTEVDFAFQTAYELFVERLPDRIYKCGLFVSDQVCVIT